MPSSHSQEPFLLVRLLRTFSSFLDWLWTKLSSVSSLLRQAWGNLKFNQVKPMTNKINAGAQGDKTKTKKSGPTQITLSSVSGSPQSGSREDAYKTTKLKNAASHIVRPFVTVFDFFNKNDGGVGAIAASVSAIATIAIVCLTFNYVKYSKKQWETMDRQLTDYEKAEAAQVAVEFSPTVKMGKPREGLIIDGNINIINIGQTTAVNFTAMGFLWNRNLEPPKPGIPGIASETASVTSLDLSGIRLGSGRSQSYPVGFQVSQLDEIRQGMWQSGVWVDFTYDDVFGRHYSDRDCFMINPANILEFIRCPKPITSITIPTQ